MDSAPDESIATNPAPSDGIVAKITDAFLRIERTVADTLALFTGEIRRAGLGVMWMIGFTIVAAILFGSAWLGLMAALALLTISFGLTWISALALVSLLSLVAALTSALVCIRLSRRLLFPAIQRRLDISSQANIRR